MCLNALCKARLLLWPPADPKLLERIVSPQMSGLDRPAGMSSCSHPFALVGRGELGSGGLGSGVGRGVKKQAGVKERPEVGGAR